MVTGNSYGHPKAKQKQKQTSGEPLFIRIVVIQFNPDDSNNFSCVIKANINKPTWKISVVILVLKKQIATVEI